MRTPRTMVTFKAHGTRFTYRIAGIIIHDGYVLFQSITDPGLEPFWFLPGGRAELNEPATETLKREMQEELGVEATIERLVYVVENFFAAPDDGAPQHELGLYFLMTFPPNSYLYERQEHIERIDEVGNLIAFDWLPLAELEQLAVQPTFLRKALQNLPEQITHIVNIDE
jgi:ADP-ribose pyrophosphatase YjhB (NUDIX family)